MRRKVLQSLKRVNQLENIKEMILEHLVAGARGMGAAMFLVVRPGEHAHIIPALTMLGPLRRVTHGRHLGLKVSWKYCCAMNSHF